MRRTILGGVLLLLSAVMASAQPPALETSQVTGRPNSLLEIRVTPTPPDGFEILSQEWLVVDPAVDWRQYESGGVFVATAPPGEYQARYRVQYVDWANKRGQADYRVYVLTVEGARPPPVVVVPDPTEPGQRLVVVVDETLDRSIPSYLYQAAQTLREQGHQVRLVDPDVQTGTGQVPREVAKAIEAARDAGLPSLVVCSVGGEVIRAVRLPGTADEVVREVER